MPIFISHYRIVPRDDPLLSASGQNRVLKIRHRLHLPGHHHPEDRLDTLPVPFGQKMVEPVFPDHLGLTISQNLASFPVDERHPAIGIDGNHHHAGNIQIILRTVSLPDERLLVLAAFGNLTLEPCIRRLQFGRAHLYPLFQIPLIRPVLQHQPAAFQRPAHAGHHIARIERFDKILIDANAHRLADIVQVRVSRHHQDGPVRILCQQTFGQRQTVHPRQLKICDGQIHGGLRQGLKRLFGRRRADGSISDAIHQPAQPMAYGVVVVHNQNRFTHRSHPSCAFSP